MQSVYKYQLNPDDHIDVDLPRGAQLLSVGHQHGVFCLWALVNPKAPLLTRHLRMAGTGHPISELPQELKFIDTVMIDGGSLVFHFFEVIA